MRKISKVETGIEKVVFSSRWLQAPIYLVLSLVLLAFVFDISKSVIMMLINIKDFGGHELIVFALTLCDAALVANLVVVVVISGYENFVSKIDVAHDKGEPIWIKKLSPTGVKMKIAGSIVAISSISLLKQFLDIAHISDRELLWNVIIHLVFVFSAIMIAFTGWLEHKVHKPH
ncbi:TIGR00645 family protein [Fangia hongkongensis]|uniref:TIGR00645 family protein n=1 Tax=Fangia hongkongensis TaxID=270495 RepID=UPI001907E3AD|nr:TIGR00645 family protein [Fangia hongkongensis]MBK2124756.1 TIGR00645 family protein [Fangia hongkongensis]